MGEVYRARDTRLGRDVALKVLPRELTSHPERLRRFQREARAASALNHPNIVAIHDVGREDGIDFLVMELVEGETLAERLARGPLSPEQVLRLGEQISSALDACHRKGMVHRDLKPANIMLTPSGVKLLDFGLARAFDTGLHSDSTSSSSSAPTAAAPLTREGIVVGTLPYMAPEQLQGGPVEARCDIFALGAVLYEALTGRRAFAGDTNTAIVRAILTSDPPPARTLAPRTPPSLDRLIQFCLEKDPERRFGSARDVGLQLSAIGEETASSGAPASNRSRTAYRVAVTLSFVSVGLLALAIIGFTRARSTAPQNVVTFQFDPPSGGGFLTHVEGPLIAVSTDGSRIAFIAYDATSTRQVWVRRIDQLESHAVEGTEGASSLFWSPDGRSIGYFTRAGQLKRVGISGAPPVTVVDLPPGIGRIGTWGATEILFSSIQGEAIYRVSPDGGDSEVVLEPDPSRDEVRASWPSFLPDGKSFLYLSKAGNGQTRLVLRRPGEDPHDVGAINSQVQYVEPGFLVYVKEGVLLAQRFDRREGRLDGTPFALAPTVRYFQSNGWAAFATSPTGTLVYRSESDVMRLVWFDRSGKILGSVGSPGVYLNLAISSDAKTVLFDRVRAGFGTFDVCSLDLARGIETRLTSSPDTEAGPRWFPDGKSITYFAVSGGSPQLVRRYLTTGSEELLLPNTGFQEPMDVSPDGRTLLFCWRNAATFNLWTLSLNEDDKQTPVPLLESTFTQEIARFSPDGRWVALVSNESGRNEAYVLPRDGKGEKTQVSSEGAVAVNVRWGRSARELLYLSPDGRMFSVSVAAGAELRLGKASTLFRLPTESMWRNFEVASDGERFLAIVTESSGDARPATVVLSWQALVEP
jgi:eukaryotic-like serine/threonine-protein kinase